MGKRKLREVDHGKVFLFKKNLIVKKILLQNTPLSLSS